jgi:hypothetical protein
MTTEVRERDTPFPRHGGGIASEPNESGRKSWKYYILIN